jgi:hypothetical protein
MGEHSRLLCFPLWYIYLSSLYKLEKQQQPWVSDTWALPLPCAGFVSCHLYTRDWGASVRVFISSLGSCHSITGSELSTGFATSPEWKSQSPHSDLRAELLQICSHPNVSVWSFCSKHMSLRRQPCNLVSSGLGTCPSYIWISFLLEGPAASSLTSFCPY